MSSRTSLAATLTLFMVGTGGALIPSAAPAQRVDSVTVPLADVEWVVDGPGRSFAWARRGGTMAEGSFHRYEAGVGTPLHEHGETVHAVMVSGTLRHRYRNQEKAQLLRAGDFWSVPAGALHEAECVSPVPCVFYTHGDVARPHDPVHLDEDAVGPWSVPDLLVREDGSPVDDPESWRARRAEILDLLEGNVFGRVPDGDVSVRWVIRSVDSLALGGSATRKEVRIHFGDAPDGPRMDLLVYTPNHVEGPAPLFLGLNFFGNHTIGTDPGVSVAEGWVSNYPPLGITENRSNEGARGSMDARWPVERIVDGGYGLATANYGDLDPDVHEGFRDGVHALFAEEPDAAGRRDPEAWGSLTAWAWGLGRALDYLETDPDVDGDRVALIGHSRLGRTAVWAGARDERFAMVVGNNAVAGVWSRDFGETVGSVTRQFPHWFAGALTRWVGRDGDLPADAHMTLALIAPRPVYLGTASEDPWAPPSEEFLALSLAAPAWELLGVPGLAVDVLPAPGDAVQSGRVGFHVRPGHHDITPWDWERYLDFADLHLRKEIVR